MVLTASTNIAPGEKRKRREATGDDEKSPPARLLGATINEKKKSFRFHIPPDFEWTKGSVQSWNDLKYAFYVEQGGCAARDGGADNDSEDDSDADGDINYERHCYCQGCERLHAHPRRMMTKHEFMKIVANYDFVYVNTADKPSSKFNAKSSAAAILEHVPLVILMCDIARRLQNKRLKTDKKEVKLDPDVKHSAAANF